MWWIWPRWNARICDYEGCFHAKIGDLPWPEFSKRLLMTRRAAGNKIFSVLGWTT